MTTPAASARFDGPVPGIPGAVIREVDSLPEHLEGAKAIGPGFEAMPGAALIEVPRIARYLVRDGKSIDVAVAPDADRSAAELFLNSARGTLIHQRGELPLNGATLIAPNWKCVAICGPSAFGKSTLAAELCRRGWLLVSDDITRVSWNGTMAVAWPNSKSVNLWRDACERMGVDTANLRPVRAGLERFYVDVACAAAPAALSYVVRLRADKDVRAVDVPAHLGMTILSESCFRPRLISPLAARTAHDRLVRQVHGTCRIVALGGARKATIEQVADVLVREVR